MEKSRPNLWKKEVEPLIHEQKGRYLKFPSTGANNDKVACKGAQARVCRKIFQRKSDVWEKNCVRLNMYMGG